MTPTQTDQTNQTSPLSFMTESLTAKELWHDPSAPNLVSPPAFWPQHTQQTPQIQQTEGGGAPLNLDIIYTNPPSFCPIINPIPPSKRFHLQLRGQASPVGNDRWGPSKRDKKERPTNSCLQRWFQYCWISCTRTSVAMYRMISI